MLSYIISDNQNITLVIDGQTYSIGADHSNHEKILNAIIDGDEDALPDLIDVGNAIESFAEGNIEVYNGEVLYRGNPVHNNISNRILRFMEQGLPYEPLIRFLDNLMENPSRRSVEELYDFLENAGMPITEDGCFVGYKGVRDDFLDVHSATIDNSPGQIIEMPRNEVDDDGRNACSYGYHVGSQAYASNWGTRVVLVKVNPRDCVSVPHEDAEKLRVCKYEVLREVESTKILEEDLWEEEEEFDLE